MKKKKAKIVCSRCRSKITPLRPTFGNNLVCYPCHEARLIV